LQEGVRLYKDGKFTEAVDRLREYLNQKPADIAARTYIGAALGQLDRFPEAAEEFLCLTRLEPGNIRHYYNLGQAYESFGNYLQAIGAYEKALQIEPDHKNSKERIKVIETKQKNLSGTQAVAPPSVQPTVYEPPVPCGQPGVPQQPMVQPYGAINQIYNSSLQIPSPRRGKTMPPWLLSTLIIFGFLVILFVGIKFADQAKVQAQEQAQAEAEAQAQALIESKKNDAWTMAKDFVRDRLKSPSTAEFPDSSDDGVVVSDNQDGTYDIVGYVDSQNSFGAMLRVKFVCKLGNTNDDNWRLYSLDILE